MTNVTAEVAAFVAKFSYDDLPAEVVARTGMLLTDIVGITMRARHEAPLTQSLLLAAQQLGLSDGEASVIDDTAGYAPAIRDHLKHRCTRSSSLGGVLQATPT
jgi:2-methylcitrate dehydratase PrpD